MKARRFRNTHITASRLKSERGWTEELIRQHLGTHDRQATNPHDPANPPMRLFLIERVERAARQNPRLHEQLRQNQQRNARRDAQRQAERNLPPEELVRRAAGMTVTLEGLPSHDPAELIGEALRQREQFAREAYGVTNPSPVDPQSPEAATLAVHMIRHRHSNYEQLLQDMPKTGDPGTDRRIYQAVRESVLHHIAQRIPQLGDTCRKLNHKEQNGR